MITGNEPAMPTDMTFGDDLVAIVQTGLTIRQHFAAMAMQGLLANNIYHKIIKVPALAETAVVYADHLIAELNKKS